MTTFYLVRLMKSLTASVYFFFALLVVSESLHTVLHRSILIFETFMSLIIFCKHIYVSYITNYIHFLLLTHFCFDNDCILLFFFALLVVFSQCNLNMDYLFQRITYPENSHQFSAISIPTLEISFNWQKQNKSFGTKHHV